jgi:AcrR family transcriptional regulator
MAKADIRARFTRKTLRDGLVEMMKLKSILDISIKEICETAGVSRSTFYAYYKDQFDLLGQMEEEILVEFDKLIQKYSPAGAMLPAKELLMLIEAVLYYIAGNSNSIQVLLSENGESDFQKKFARYFTGHMRQLKYIPSGTLADKRIMNYRSVFFRDGCIAMLQEWLKSGMDMSIRDMAKLFTKLIRAALG